MEPSAARALARALVTGGLEDGRLIAAFPDPPDRAAAEAAWGLPLPDDLLDLLSLVNGAECRVRGCSLAEIFGLPKDHEDVRSLIRRSKLFVEDRWFGGCVPFGSDGCGSVHVLVPSPIGPGYWTAFCDHEAEHDESRPIDYYTASSLWHFLIGELQVSPSLPEPDRLSEHPWLSESPSWPFDREIVAGFDAELAAYDGPFVPWAVD